MSTLFGKKTYEPDWRPTKRTKDSKAMRARHEVGCFCVLNCGDTGETHHVLSRVQGGDDVAANLLCLCTRHHQQITDENKTARERLGAHLVLERPDTISYIRQKLGEEKGSDWLRRRLFVT